MLIGALRIAIACVPSQRTAGEGDAVLLSRPATRGTLGALQDWLRLATGTRLLPMAVIGAVLQQPPLAVMVQQALLILLTSDNAGYCTSQLLSEPLMQHRLAALSHVLDAWTPIVAPSQATLSSRTWAGLSGAQGERTGQSRCQQTCPVVNLTSAPCRIP